MKKILLKNARVVSSHGIDEKDVVVSGGEILKVCETGEGEDLLEQVMEGASEEEAEVIDCEREGLYLLPGLIDAHVHFRDPGLTQKGDWASESSAALAGGVTTVFDMPNTVPPVLTKEAFVEKLEIAKRECKCNFRLFMGGGDLDEIKQVAGDPELAGFLAGVKVYMGDSTGDLGTDGEVLDAILGDSKLANVPVVVHAEDQACLVENEGEFDLEDPVSHGRARSVRCAVEAVKEACHLARKNDRALHIAHVSSREELDVIAKFREDGGRLVTCEVSPHHLFLSEKDYERFGHFLKVNPPVRSAEEVAKLWEAVYSEEVDIIATDNSPHTREEKESKNPPSGMPEVQTLLPLLLNEVAEEKLSLEAIVRLCCERPAEIFGLEDVGRIEDGCRADLVLVDMEKEWTVKAGDLLYKCGWSNYEGLKLRGGVERVILVGEVT
jgi:dihydroorotase